MIDSSSCVSIGGGWDADEGALEIENDGNVNISVDINSNATGVEFLGTNGLFAFMVNESEANSCNFSNSLNDSCDDVWLEFPASDADTGVCEFLDFTDAKDTLFVHLKLNISKDSNLIGKVTSATITATGTAAS